MPSRRPASAQRAVQLRIALIGAIGLVALIGFVVLAVTGRGSVPERMGLLPVALGCATALQGAPRNEPPPAGPDLAADLLKNGV